MHFITSTCQQLTCLDILQEREAEDERRMRREIEARFEEKLKLKILDAERLQAEVGRLKQAGEQLGPVLTELEHTKAEARHAAEHKDREIHGLQAALRETQAHRQKAEGRLQVLTAEMEQWNVKVKNAEELRYVLLTETGDDAGAARRWEVDMVQNLQVSRCADCCGHGVVFGAALLYACSSHLCISQWNGCTDAV